MSDSEGGDLKSIVKAGAEVVTELAKADQEQQKTFQAAIDLVRRAGGYLGGVFGPASHELSLLFGEQMRFWRFKNAVNTVLRTWSSGLDGNRSSHTNSIGRSWPAIPNLRAMSFEESN